MQWWRQGSLCREKSDGDEDDDKGDNANDADMMMMMMMIIMMTATMMSINLSHNSYILDTVRLLQCRGYHHEMLKHEINIDRY